MQTAALVMVALSVRADVTARIKPIAIKKHGRKAVSLFALGLAAWQKIFAVAAPTQMIEQVITAIRQCLPRLPKSPILHAL